MTKITSTGQNHSNHSSKECKAGLPLAVDADIPTIKAALEGWKPEDRGRSLELYAAFKDRIRAFLDHPNSEEKNLDLKLLCPPNSLVEIIPPLLQLNVFASLQTLSLEYHNLSHFPIELIQLPNLSRLDLGYNQITTLPPEIGRMQKLRGLNCTCNSLTTVPRELFSLSLMYLNLSGNHGLTGLPLEITNLSSYGFMDVTCCGFSRDVLLALRRITEQPNYRGPRISHSMIDDHLTEEEDNRSIEELLQELYDTAERCYKPLSNFPEEVVTQIKLRSWLARLSYMQDYKSTKEQKKWLATQIVNYLEIADENSEYRENHFAPIVKGADETCGDRMALSIVYLGIACELTIIDISDSTYLANFLVRGVWAMDLLEQCAREKVLTLPFYDEISIYLGYPIMLKEKLQLPINAKEMLYFNFSGLTQNDLDEAALLVQKKQADETERASFLISQRKWIEALAAKFPEQLKKIESEKEEQALQAEAYEDSQRVERETKEKLVALTMRALGKTE